MSSPRSRRWLVVILLILLALLALFLVRCSRTPAATTPPSTAPDAAVTAAASPAAAPVDREPDAPEVLTAATLEAPAAVGAGAAFSVRWTGPNNLRDYVTVVPVGAPAAQYESYADTSKGSPAELKASVEPGAYEVRYVAGKSHTVLARAAIGVQPVTATLKAPATAMLGSELPVEWTGPANEGDFITVVAKETPDQHATGFTYVAQGSPLTVGVPMEAGEAEVRYLTGSGRKVLARIPVQILAPEITLSAADKVTAGSVLDIAWSGPSNRGDYVTIVPRDLPDGRYLRYADVAGGPTLQVVAPIDAGPAEIRYMTAKGAKVLARREVDVVAANVTLEAPERVVAGSEVAVNWTGPNNASDYITIVVKGTPDGRYARYTDTARGTPMNVTAPIDVGPAEIRYMSAEGGGRVLARRALTVVAAEITLEAPETVVAGETLTVSWSGPNHAGDYLTIVEKAAAASVYGDYVDAPKGSPANLQAPRTAGDAEVRYISGQGRKILAARPIKITAP